jgi:tRNA threonylcarbamoyladenosine modification (KEOPS) complex  Pcc1 subunit
MNTAVLKLKVNNAEIIKKAILPEILDNSSERANVKIKAKKDDLILEFTANDINALKVFINHVLRIIMTCSESMKL